jgi:phosphoenolpyruvate synthase/pyruvate phosphate dikinase
MLGEAEIVWFDDKGPLDPPTLGGKCRNLVALTRAGLPVPPGFAIPVETFFAFIDAAELREKLDREMKSAATSIDEVSAARIMELFTRASMPAAFRRAILDGYSQLGTRTGIAKSRVAVRSSATTEDLETASAAGQQLTLLDISGDDTLIAAVLQCWASLFSYNALSYRMQRGLHHGGDLPGMAVGVQALVQAQASGVMFTVDPISGDSSRIVVEAIGGLGEPLVGGEVTPDRYIIDKRSGRIVEQRIGDRAFELVCTGSGSVRRDVPVERRRLPCLTHDGLDRLLELSGHVEGALGSGQDIEWAFDESGRCHLLQARPITASGRPLPAPDASTHATRPRSALLGELYRRWPGS